MLNYLLALFIVPVFIVWLWQSMPWVFPALALFVIAVLVQSQDNDSSAETNSDQP